MKTKEQIENALAKCEDVMDWETSSGPCPFGEMNERGWCAQCSFPAAMRWVLDGEGNPTDNAQTELIKTIVDG